MQGMATLVPLVGVAAACRALDVNRASYYRARKGTTPKPRPRPARALSATERREVLAVLDSDAFMDKAQAQVYAKLLDDGEYLCSTRRCIGCSRTPRRSASVARSDGTQST